MLTRVRSGRVVVVMAATLLGGGISAWATAPDRVTDPAAAAAAVSAPSPTTTARSAAEPTSQALTPAPQATVPATPDTAGSASSTTSVSGAAPVRVAVARLGIDMPVIPAGVESDGQMEIPPSPGDAGWYRYGPGVGARQGATVIAAHVDAEGEVGPLASLGGARQDDEIIIRGGERDYRYRVTSVTQIDKDALDLPGLFARDGSPRVHLVTCGGRFDRAAGHYEDNVVVVAIPAG